MQNLDLRPLSAGQASVSIGVDAEFSDYFALLKPRVMALVVFTAFVGMAMTPSSIHPVLAVASLLMIAIGAGASGCLNMVWDADIDARMRRTANRPIPAGRIAPQQALAFGMTLSVGSVLCLGLIANWLAASLLAFTIFFYAVIYTIVLKRRTPQNIVIGGAAGALPPVVGAAAVSGSIPWVSLALFLIIFVWTPPHFWALALLKADDYARAGVPMMPNVAGPESTRRQILAYTLILIPISFLPAVLGAAHWLYIATAAGGGLGMLLLSLRVLQQDGGTNRSKAPGQLFGFSILYLFSLFAALLAERIALTYPL